MHTSIASDVTTIRKGESLSKAAQLMSAEELGCLVVTDDDGTAVGILTDRDLAVRAVARNYTPADTPVFKVMTSPLFSGKVGADPEVVLGRMRSLGVRRLPVLDEERRPVGLLALDDVLVQVARRYSDLAAAAAPPPKAEKVTLLGDLEHTLGDLRRKAAGAAWRVEASFFDQLDSLRDSVRKGLGADDTPRS